MNLYSTIKELKEHNQDFEFYPTTKEMIECIFNDLKRIKPLYYRTATYFEFSFLDIGCGNGNFINIYREIYGKQLAHNENIKNHYIFQQEIINLQNKIKTDYDTTTEKYKQKYITGIWSDYKRKVVIETDYLNEETKKEKLQEAKQEIQSLEEQIKQLNTEYTEEIKQICNISNYYVIEKSQILINQLDKNAIIIGTDFNNTTLIDKEIDVIFCNPPYSEYEEWTCKIIKEGFCKVAYLVIPQRWENSKIIKDAIEKRNVNVSIIYTGDFLEAERQARAKVNIVKIEYKTIKNKRDEEIKEDPFEKWFEEFFNVKANQKQEIKKEWEIEREKQKNIQDKIQNELQKAKSIDDVFVDLYLEEQNKMINSYKSLCSLDEDILKELNVNLHSLKDGLKIKIKGLKNLYWKELFNKLDKITDRLTNKTRKNLLHKLMSNSSVDFIKENIYAVVSWAIKNANVYYNQQIIDLFLDFTTPDNVKKYKSNQKTWSQERWRFADDKSHYTLEYRLIMSNHNFGYNHNSWKEGSQNLFYDLYVVAKNLGFEIDKNDFRPYEDGKRRQVYYKNNNKVFMEYKSYKNGNFHLFLDKEFVKAFNIEASRLLGWIKDWSDVEKDFDITDCEMKNEDKKYFKSSFCIDVNSNILKLEI